ncbi:MAG: biotin/lipoyl-binding protein [Pseudomonadales bacterium]|nr:biotin/lipoyl-binding protein [Pseudomonadales bacterium]
MARVEIESDVQGNVWKVLAAAGETVAAGDVLMILESMKMEIPVEAPVAGRLLAVHVTPGQAVAEGQVVALVEA